MAQHLTGVTEKTREIIKIGGVPVEIGTKRLPNGIP
jgi:hypothetical protein